MAATTSSTGQVSRLQQTTERLRLESAQLRERLRGERDAVRALRAQHSAELRAERKAARCRRIELEAQLQESSKTKSTTSNATACEQCAKNKAIHETELRKLNVEFKRKEQQLKGQLNEKGTNTNSTAGSSISACEQCAKQKALHDAEIRKLNLEFKKKEQQLKGQLNEKALPVVTTATVASSCEQCAKVKALHEADIRKLNVEFKKKEHQLKGQLNELKKVASVDNTDGGVCQTCQRLNGDLAKQKEVSKDLEERLQKAIDADRLKAADLRAQHEKHVTELSRITRANKHDAHKLLEELKTKDRIIEQLRRSAGKTRTKGEEAGIEHTQMRKLREEVRKNEQPALLPPACDPKPETLTHHDKFRQNEVELNVSIKQRDQMVCGAANEDLIEHPETDTDSAVSSAPSSLSPQPCSPAAASLRDRATPPPTSLSPQPSEGYTTPPPGLWPDLESYDDDGGNNELSMARRQVRELERALLVTRATKSSSRHVTALSERVRQLEEREAELLRELGDLREQNELLEFRVLELAECPDKSSFSTSTWSVPDHRDVSTATDDVAERLNDEPIRRRLTDITSRADDLEDKRCLMQVLLLLHGLDELSKRTEPYNVETAMQIYNEREHTPPISLTSVRGARDRTGPDRDRLVAKVPPFTGRTADSDDDRESPLRSHDSSTSPAPVNSRGTQTEVTETSAEEDDSTKSLNLTAEVRKLDKLRETIDRNGRLVVSGSGCVGGCEQKHTKQLEFYRERVDVLERKLCVYESSGEQQARQLAERLSREVILEAQVKQFTATIHKLQSENSRLEEERCELEEAENDTRLRCQRLEADILQLERSRMSAKRRAKDSRQQATYWESMVNKYEERNYELEERECELRHRLEVMEKTAPAILLFNMWKTLQDEPKLDVISATVDRLKRLGGRSRSSQRSKSRSPLRSSNNCVCESYLEKIKDLEKERNKTSCVCENLDQKIKVLENERQKLVDAKQDMERKVRALETQLTDLKQSTTTTAVSPSGGQSRTSLMSGDFELMQVVQELRERENQMKKRIEDLEQREIAYMETLQQADDIWADMEKGYKQRISDAEQSEASMRDRMRRLEKREPVNYDELEDAERELAARAERLSRENSRLQAENKRLERELCQCISQDDRAREIEARADKLSSELERERRRSQALEQRLLDDDATLSEALRTHSAEAEALRERLARTANELVHLEVTNGELREEVDTLESKIAELDRGAQERAAADEQVIRGLSQELNDRDKELADMKEKGFAAEAGERLGNALQSVKACDVCSQSVNPVLVDTVEGVRTLCQLMSCQDSRPPDDAQVSSRSPKQPCTVDTCDKRSPKFTADVKDDDKVCSTSVCDKLLQRKSGRSSKASSVSKLSSVDLESSGPVSGKTSKSGVSASPSTSAKSDEEADAGDAGDAPKETSGKLSGEPSQQSRPDSAASTCMKKSCSAPCSKEKAGIPAITVTSPGGSTLLKDTILCPVESKIPSGKSRESTCTAASCKAPCGKVSESATSEICPIASKSKKSVESTCTAASCKAPCSPSVKASEVGPVASKAKKSAESTCSEPCKAPCAPSVKASEICPVASIAKKSAESTCTAVSCKAPCAPSAKASEICPVASIAKKSAESTCSEPCKAPCAPSVKASEICPVASIAKKSADSTCLPAACKAPCAPVSRVSFADQVAEKESADAAALVPADEGSQQSIEQFDLLTEVMVAGQPEYTSIQARVDMDPEHKIEGVTVMASVTDSGNLELTTESPPGLIEHTMEYTPSGNMEVITGFSPRDSSELDKVPSYFHREEEPVAPDIESQDQEPSLTQPDVASAGDEIQNVIDAEMADVESARTGLSGEGEEASERKSGSLKTDFTAEHTVSFEESVPGTDAIQSEIEAEIDIVPQKISFSIESEEIRKSSTGSGGSLVELLKEVTYSAEKLDEIMDRTDETSKKSSGVISGKSPSAKSPSAKSIKSPSEKSSEIKSPSEKSSEIKSPLDESSGIKSPSEKSSGVKSPSEKSSEVIETIAAVKEIEEESVSSVSSAEGEPSTAEGEPSTAESEPKVDETIYESPEGTKVLIEDEIEPEQKSEFLIKGEIQEVPTKDVCICEPTKDDSKIPCACSTASQTVSAPRQKSESALCTCPIGIFPVDLYGQPPGSQQLLCVCTMYKSQQPQQQPQQCMPPNMIQGMSPQQMMQPQMMQPQMMHPQMMPPQPMSSQYYQPYVPCPAYGYPGSSMSYGSPQYPSLQQQAPYQNAQGPQDICDPTCSGKKEPPREPNLCEKYSCPAYEKAGEGATGEEPAEEEPAAEESVTEEPVTEEPVTEEPVAEEPAAEESITEEPSVVEEPAEEITVEEGLLEEPPDEQYESAAGTLSVSLEISVDEAKTPSKTSEKSVTSGGDAICSIHSDGGGEIIEKECTPVSSGRSSKGSPSAHSTKESTPAAATPTEASLKESARSKSSVGSQKSSGSKIPVPVSPATTSATSRSPKSKSPVLSPATSRSPTTKSPSKSQTSKSPQISSPVRSSGSRASAKASRKSTDSGKGSQKSGDGGRIVIPNKSRSESSKSYHGQGCNCEICQCNPCKDPKIAAHKRKDYDALYPECCPQCLCEICRCPNCVDPRKKRIAGQKSGADDVTAAGLLDRNILPHDLGLPCDCEECECGPCKDPNIVGAKPGSQSSSEASSAAGIKSVTSGECSEATSVPSMRGEEYTEAPTIEAVVECEIPCPCPPCVCDPCDDPNYHIPTSDSPETSPDKRRSSVTFDLAKTTSDQPIKEGRAPSSEAVRSSRPSSEAVRTSKSVDTVKSFKVGDRTIDVAYPANRTDIHSLNITQTHPVDCDCPICKCDPCNKTEKGASTTVILEPPSAGCSEYFSAEAGSSNECESAPCPFGKPVQVGDRTIDINYPVSGGSMRSVAVCPSGHPVDCQCFACTCGPCSNTTGAGTQTAASGVDAATCPFMTAVKVEDRTINIHYPVASHSTRALNICPSGHPVDCQCVKCLCDPCSKDFGGRTGTAATVQFKKQSGTDSCPMMQSVAVEGRTIDIHYPISSSSSKVLNVCPIGHPVNCQCLKCLCQPCSKSLGPSATRASTTRAGSTGAVEPCICGPSGGIAPVAESTRTTAGVTSATEPCICSPSGGIAPIAESTRTAGLTSATEPCICSPSGGIAPIAKSPRTTAGVTSATEPCTCSPSGGIAPIAESTRITAESCPLMQSVQVAGRSIDIHYPATTSSTRILNVCPSGHPVDCQCVKCLCQPCSKSLGTVTKAKTQGSKSIGVEARTGVGIGVGTESEHSAECDCVICECNPCSDSFEAKRKAASSPNTSNLCDCKPEQDTSPCPFMQNVQVADRSIGIHYPIGSPSIRTLNVCPSGHPVDCQCVTCVCNPCSKNFGGSTQKPSTAPQIQRMPVTADDSCVCKSEEETAPCPFMQNVQVADRSIGIHYPIGSSSIRTLNVCPSGHPVDCQCVACVCNPCSKNFGGSTQKPSAVPQSQRMPVTADDSCVCKSEEETAPCPFMQNVQVADRSIGIHYPIGSSSIRTLNVCPSGHPVDCQCVVCVCNPCSKNIGGSTQKPSAAPQSQRMPVTADDSCVCKSEEETAPCPFMQNVQVADRSIGIHYPIGSSSIRTLNVCPSGHPVDCQCVVCVCNPCSKNIGGSTKKPSAPQSQRMPVTADDSCVCKSEEETAPCPFMQNVQVADRSIGIHYPIGSSSIRTLNVCPSGHPVDCQCVVCVCNPCSKNIGGSTQKPSAVPQSQRMPVTAGDSCVCKSEEETAPCPFMQSVKVADRSIGIHYPIGSSSIRTLNICPSGHPVDCQCVACVCNPCSKNIGGSTQKPSAAPQSQRMPVTADDSCICKSEEETAPCPFMQSVKVADRSIGIHYPIGSSSIRTLNVCPSGHPVDCQCVTCVCNPCSKNAGGSPQKPSTAPQSKRVSVTEDPCVCKPEEETAPCPFMQTVQVADRSIGIHYPIDSSSIRALNVCPSGHPVDCTCVACVCNPCSKDSPGTGNLQKVPHGVSCECPKCLCNPCAPPGSQNVPERLPASKLGPGFSKSAVKTSASSRYECEIRSGKEAAVRSVAVSGTEDWRNLDSDTLKQKLMGMENEARERANEIAQIRKFIGGLQSQCSCSQNQSGAKNQMAESRSFEQTISGLQCALAFLQEKCRKKDRMIVAFSEELRLRADSCVFDTVLHKIAAEKEFKPSPDFDRITAAATLPKPTDTPRQVMRTPAEKPCSPPVKPPSSKDDGCPCKTGASKNVDPSPLALTDVRRISPDSLLLKWDRPASQDIKGYEVEVNGEVKSRIHSAGRNATVLNGLEIKGTMNLSVIAISTDGDRCSPPATAVYEPRPSSPKSEKGKCSC